MSIHQKKVSNALTLMSISFGLMALTACNNSTSNESKSSSQPASKTETMPAAVPATKAEKSDITIGQIQGSDEASSMVGETVTIKGIVTANTFSNYKGIYIQSTPVDTDDNPATSEGLFVHFPEESQLDLMAGDVLTLTGTITEFKGQTQLSDVSDYQVVTKSSATATPVSLPLPEGTTWESYENMLITFPNPMVVSETYNLGRYGQVVLSQDKRLVQPTQHLAAGEASLAEGAAQASISLLLDDGSDKQNPSPIPFLRDGNTLRSGDSLKNLTGILQYRYDSYVLISPDPVKFIATNPRSAEPPKVGGNVKVASFNVLNLFNGDGNGGDFPTPRGANNPVEYGRQFAKITNAIHALDADIVGLMEIENDGYEETSALSDLLLTLNEMAKSPEDQYDFVQPEESMGGDAIKVAMIYRPAVVSLVGKPALINDGPLAYRRPSLVGTFEHSSGDALTVVVNHLKSKGCGNSSGANADQGDGQGCYNAERVESAQAIIAALKSDLTEIEESDILIIGDLNSYTNEEPILEFTQNGYHDALREKHGAENIHTYVYAGNAGVLDHAIVSDSLLSKVAGASPWHINADEPRILDYNTEYNPKELFDESPFRSSDHDPVLVGLNLGL